MNYQEFKNILKDRMQKIMGDTIQVEFETYIKNNQTKIESLIFKERDSSGAMMISPAVHMQDLYNLYHLLNHLNLFGQAYLPSVLGIIGGYRI